MSLTNFISNIILSMREFQKEKFITKQCVTNTQFLYDIITTNCIGIDVKVKAVIVVSTDDETNSFTFVGGHLVLVLNDETIIDPSYDVFSLKNKSYFHNIKDVMDSFDNKSKEIIKTKFKNEMGFHIQFMKIAEQKNNNKHIITEKQFYHNQADYIEKLYVK